MLPRIVVKLNWVVASYVAVVDFDAELLNVVMLIFSANNRLELKSVVNQSELSLYLAQVCAVVNDYTKIFEVSPYFFYGDGERKVTERAQISWCLRTFDLGCCGVDSIFFLFNLELFLKF